MTRLASITFHGDKNQVGGAQIPAMAFAKWCHIFDIDCDYLCSPLRSYVEENYTGVFFCTPPSDEWIGLSIPYVSMIHAEFDKPTIAWANSKAIVVIGLGYWDVNSKPELLWYPCTYPEYLPHESDVWPDSSQGLVYAARISTWKNASMLAGLTRYKPFRDRFMPIDIYGAANNDMYNIFVEDINPLWNRRSEVFDNRDFYETRKRFYGKEFFWAVSGTKSYEIRLPRIELSAVEAVKFGCLPIVNINNVQQDVARFCIDINNINSIPMRSNAFYQDKVLESCVEYNRVKLQVERIIGELV